MPHSNEYPTTPADLTVPATPADPTAPAIPASPARRSLTRRDVPKILGKTAKRWLPFYAVLVLAVLSPVITMLPDEDGNDWRVVALPIVFAYMVALAPVFYAICVVLAVIGKVAFRWAIDKAVWVGVIAGSTAAAAYFIWVWVTN
ncbi:hypothetical protein [Rarobacter incanus]|uniref:Uncharacterized protein n=1 Tax=Rarobacter incanus TaxID=153494 RepID=A0A542SRL4_9MICO|nr:hypothetical protein [Rarobacter incanus]TQK77234.1 hypothetical protein FB389_1951 [Rarobacter incanus]